MALLVAGYLSPLLVNITNVGLSQRSRFLQNLRPDGLDCIGRRVNMADI